MKGKKYTHRLIGPFSQMVTMNELSPKGPLEDSKMKIIENGGLLLKDDKISATGEFEKLYTQHKGSCEVIKIESDAVCMPGLIDAHTHICYSGSRAGDYAARNTGKSYLEIAEAGGGIWSSVKATRAASEDELIKGVVNRATRHLKNGITTIEVKSGYGLNVESELKMMRAIKMANALLKCDLVSTCLAAHTIPKDFNGSQEDYLSIILNELLPKVKQEKLSERVDVFIEKGSFTSEPAKGYLEECKNRGFEVTVHADQFSTGGSEVAVKVGAISADHLEASTTREIDMIAKSNTIPIALPGASLGLGCGFTPARKLLDAGSSLAIASDWNPGSAPMGNLLMQASVLGTYEKLSTAEVFAGVTFRAARALKLNDRGILANGMLADFILFPTNDYKEILYQQGMMTPFQVWKSGNKI